MTIIKFAHLADIHLGSFRDKKMRSLQIQQFSKAIETILDNSYDFVLISGDIFNVSNPPLEYVELVISRVKELREVQIPVFVIGGSHDYSLTHKSFIQLLDSAGIWRNVGKWRTLDTQKIELIPTTVKIKGINIDICGVLGRKNGLDLKVYQKLQENESTQKLPSAQYSIFMFHSTITELLPSKLSQSPMQTYSKTILPKGFNYYAGGHIHYPNSISIHEHGLATYSGPIFPNSFTEFKDGFSGFNEVIYNTKTKNQSLTYISLSMPTIIHLLLDCSNIHPNEINTQIDKKINELFSSNSFNFKDSIILFELTGVINSSTAIIDVSRHISKLYELGAYSVLKNTQKLHSIQMQRKEQKHSFSTVQQLEEKVIKQYFKEHQSTNQSQETSFPIPFQELTSSILNLDVKKLEDETNYHFEERVISSVKQTINAVVKKI